MTEEAPCPENSLYSSLKRVGVYNITSFMKRLGIEPKDQAAAKGFNEAVERFPYASDSTIEDGEMERRAKQLLLLMGLEDTPQNASTLISICLHGRDLLGPMSKRNIAAAPMDGNEQPLEADTVQPREQGQ